MRTEKTATIIGGGVIGGSWAYKILADTAESKFLGPDIRQWEGPVLAMESMASDSRRSSNRTPSAIPK